MNGNWYYMGEFGAHNFYLINDADFKLKYDDHAISIKARDATPTDCDYQVKFQLD